METKQTKLDKIIRLLCQIIEMLETHPDFSKEDKIVLQADKDIKKVLPSEPNQ